MTKKTKDLEKKIAEQNFMLDEKDRRNREYQDELIKEKEAFKLKEESAHETLSRYIFFFGKNQENSLKIL